MATAMSTRRLLGLSGTALLTGLLALSESNLFKPVAAAGPIAVVGSTEANLKVAFIGDQGSTADAIAVLHLIWNEQADMVLHQGDFDYGNPTQWDDLVTSVLGPSFPYFGSVGNHDAGNFYGASGYQSKLLARLARLPPGDASCSGDLGVNSACTYKGLFFILSGVGSLGSGHEAYLDQQLAADHSTWRICSWHKDQNAMQVGGKSNEVGWLAYETCLARGAIIATAHEHSYSRTKTLLSMQNQTVDPAWPSPVDLRLAPGATFAFVSGLGGRSIRNQERCLPTTYPYGCKGEWANIYTSDQGAQFGALFIEFNVDGDPHKARGYFKNLSGVVTDQFQITSQMVAPNPDNVAPVVDWVSADLPSAYEGVTVSLSAGFTDADSTDTHTATINWGDGSVQAAAVSETGGTGTGTVAGTHAYSDNGSYTPTVKVSDSWGAAGSADTGVTVLNRAPTASAGGPYTGFAGSPITFSGSATDPGAADVLTYQWDLNNDGSFETTGRTVQGTFAQAGGYTVALQVQDDDGGTSGVATATVTVGVLATADLSVSELTAPTVNVAAGQAITVSDKTKNKGKGGAGTSATFFYWSTDTKLSANDAPLGSRAVGLLGAGASSTGSAGITVPAGTAAGKYYVLAKADGNGDVAETNEDNNVRQLAVYVGPDLVVSTLTAPSSVTRGVAVVVTVDTKNAGGAAAGESTTRLYVSADTKLDAGDTLVATIAVPMLEAGAVSRATPSVVVPSTAGTGKYRFLAVSDATGFVVESRETNNAKDRSVTLQ